LSSEGLHFLFSRFENPCAVTLKNDAGDIWTRAANYHSRSPQHNAAYRADLMLKAKKWADWLAARFFTVDVTKAATGSGATDLSRDRSRFILRKPIYNTPSGFIRVRLVVSEVPPRRSRSTNINSQSLIALYLPFS
jgi:hypothetical protein